MLLTEYAVKGCLFPHLAYLMSLHYQGNHKPWKLSSHLNAGYCFAKKHNKTYSNYCLVSPLLLLRYPTNSVNASPCQT